MIEIKKVKNLSEIKVIAQLAKEILHEVYDPIISVDHTRYFINEFQSEEAIKEQIDNKDYHYYLLKYDNVSSGYLGLQKKEDLIILSKLYLLKNYRGKNIGNNALKFVHKFALQYHISTIQLLVNTQNQNAIDIYIKNGFKIADSILNSFPNGHTVEDYLMKKKI